MHMYVHRLTLPLSLYESPSALATHIPPGPIPSKRAHLNCLYTRPTDSLGLPAYLPTYLPTTYLPTYLPAY